MDNTLTTPQGVAIQPIVYPLNEGTATRLSVLVLNFETTATTCTTYWQLLTEDGKQLSQGNYTLTEEQFVDKACELIGEVKKNDNKTLHKDTFIRIFKYTGDFAKMRSQ